MDNFWHGIKWIAESEGIVIVIIVLLIYFIFRGEQDED